MSSAIDAPFFIVGAQRSGTTLLRLMLANHPRIAVPPESHFLPELLRLEHRWKGLSNHRERVGSWLSSHERLADFGLDRDWIRERMGNLEPLTTRTITEELFGEYTRRQGKVRWGDKTPRYRNHIPEILDVFQDARFIHLLRDGRDAALSSWKARFGPRTWVTATYFWRDAVRAAWRGASYLPEGQLLEIRYEDLLHRPEESLRRICDFLGEPFDRATLDFWRGDRRLVPSWEHEWHSKVQQEVDPQNTEKWRTQLSPLQVATFQRIAGRELLRAGYPMEPVRLTIGQSLRTGLEQLTALTKKTVVGVFWEGRRRLPGLEPPFSRR